MGSGRAVVHPITEIYQCFTFFIEFRKKKLCLAVEGNCAFSDIYGQIIVFKRGVYGRLIDHKFRWRLINWQNGAYGQLIDTDTVYGQLIETVR